MHLFSTQIPTCHSFGKAQPDPARHNVCRYASVKARAGNSTTRQLSSVSCAVQPSETAAFQHHQQQPWQPLASTSAASAAAVAMAMALLMPVQSALALPEAQLEQIREAIDKDFQDGQYYVTGNLTRDLYAPDCRFKDPTTDVKGVEPYTTAVAALFDPAVSRADLISSTVSGPNSITLRWRLEGKLKLGNLPIKPYTGTTIYTLDDSTGKITAHTETWDISALDAFVSTLVPGFGAPPAPPVAK